MIQVLVTEEIRVRLGCNIFFLLSTNARAKGLLWPGLRFFSLTLKFSPKILKNSLVVHVFSLFYYASRLKKRIFIYVDQFWKDSRFFSQTSLKRKLTIAQLLPNKEIFFFPKYESTH